MWNKMLKTSNSPAPLIARLALGIMIFPHGAAKLLGWFEGPGFEKMMATFTGQMGIPWIFGFAAIVAEFFGGLGLITGLFTRLSALGVGITMLVAAKIHWTKGGFFMNWFMVEGKEHGIEFHILAIGLAASLVITGGGLFALDSTVGRKKDKKS